MSSNRLVIIAAGMALIVGPALAGNYGDQRQNEAANKGGSSKGPTAAEVARVAPGNYNGPCCGPSWQERWAPTDRQRAAWRMGRYVDSWHVDYGAGSEYGAGVSSGSGGTAGGWTGSSMSGRGA
jgi:hypothetical protein